MGDDCNIDVAKHDTHVFKPLNTATRRPLCSCIHRQVRGTRGHGLIEPLLARKRGDMAKKLITPGHRGGSVLDIGHGAFPLFLGQVEAKERHGIDRIPNPAAAEWARRGVHLLCQDIEQNCLLPYPTAYFDVVTMLAVFEHIAQYRLQELLGEVHRVLRPGGIYVMTTPAAWTGWLLALLSGIGVVSHDEIDEHKGSYSHREIRQTLERAGFEPGLIRTGHFELFANAWAVATRELTDSARL